MATVLAHPSIGTPSASERALRGIGKALVAKETRTKDHNPTPVASIGVLFCQQYRQFRAKSCL